MSTLSERLTRDTVEPAGVCADGDRCPRWHCRTCGRYWLGDPDDHLCRLAETVVHWMKEALRQERQLELAARTVLDRVKAAGLGEQLLDTYGAGLIVQIWHAQQLAEYSIRTSDRVAQSPREIRRAETTASMTTAAPAPAATDHASNGVSPVPPRSAQVTQGTRRVGVGQLGTSSALLESLVQIEGKWIRLGDLDKRQCRALERQHRDAANAFGRLADRLSEGQTVRQRWTAEQLEDLVGDTLHAAAPALPSSQRR